MKTAAEPCPMHFLTQSGLFGASGSRTLAQFASENQPVQVTGFGSPAVAARQSVRKQAALRIIRPSRATEVRRRIIAAVSEAPTPLSATPPDPRATTFSPA